MFIWSSCHLILEHLSLVWDDFNFAGRIAEPLEIGRALARVSARLAKILMTDVSCDANLG